jgi:hypothetical protein
MTADPRKTGKVIIQFALTIAVKIALIAATTAKLHQKTGLRVAF